MGFEVYSEKWVVWFVKYAEVTEKIGDWCDCHPFPYLKENAIPNGFLPRVTLSWLEWVVMEPPGAYK